MMLRGVPALLASLVTTVLIGWASHADAAVIPGDADPPEVVIVNGSVADALGPEEVIVNGSLSLPIARGEAIKQHGAALHLQVPLPETLSAERLLTQHPAALVDGSSCGRKLCLISESIDAQLLAQPEVRYLVGLRFDSLLGSAPSQRAPVNLVAVVDGSESMRGAALELTKASLTELVWNLTAQDQLSIVVYADTAHTQIAPTAVTPKGRKRLLAAIGKLRSKEGDSNLQSGLDFGYGLAHTAGDTFEGSDRVLWFTDEAPDEARLAEVMTLAEGGARLGVGLTMVGVGMAFDLQLATAMGNISGGNHVLVRNQSELGRIFGEELRTLIGELAHEVRISLTPASGYRIAGVYGIPGAQVHYAGKQGIEITLATAFLGLRAGQLFVSLTPLDDVPAPVLTANEPLARVEWSYKAVDDREVVAESQLVFSSSTPSQSMQLGRLLLDEFTTLRRASIAYHVDSNEQAAFELMHALAPRLRNSRIPGLDGERRVVNLLEEQLAFLSGHGDDSGLVRSRMSRLWGVWRVRSVQGNTDFRTNERIEFTPDSQFRFFEKAAGHHVLSSVANISTSRQQIVMNYSGVVYNYEVRGSELVLEERPGTLVFLQRSRLQTE